MNDRTFVDSNVLIYAYDSEAGTKHRIANSILRELWEQRLGVLSVQVLQEFYVNVTRKIPKPIPKSKARLFAESYMNWCSDTTTAEIATAFRIEDEARIGFWDALIVASALKSRAQRILSEDFNAGQRIAGIVIENPFVMQ
jgi:predicted nucleic acid-binding protein